MSTELERLEDQLRRSFEGEAWHGPSVLEALKDVTPEMAHAHPVPGAHSIWELVLHLATDYHLVLRRMGGEDAQLSLAEGWPPVPSPTESAWSEAIHSLQELNARMRAAIRRFEAERLDQPFTSQGTYPAYTQFIGITQHGLYHAGQIAILKKALGAERGAR
jgi:uncharacterized damage-inducible protein DinB